MAISDKLNEKENEIVKVNKYFPFLKKYFYQVTVGYNILIDWQTQL